MGLMDRLNKSDATAEKKETASAGAENNSANSNSQSSNQAAQNAELDRFEQDVLSEVAAELAKRDDPDSEDLNLLISQAIDSFSRDISKQDKQKIASDIYDEITGYGPLEQLLKDPSISEIMVNGPDMIFVERKGKVVLSDVKFKDNDHVKRIIDKIVNPLGRRCDDSNPMVDARLPDGSRVNAIIPPLALNGPTITIRKFSNSPLTINNLISFGSMNNTMSKFLAQAVKGKLNILVSGGTGSGKTTLLNVLSSFIPHDERIVTIEDAAEIQLMQEHVVSLESRPANLEGQGAVTIRDLVKNALRMRPDRIVVGEVRGGETLDMLSAMNTGHDGSLTTAHANTPRDALSRVETMVMMAGMELPVSAIRAQTAGALDLIVQQARLRDGSRKITSITEILGMEGDTIITQELFRFVNTGFDENNKITGYFEATGVKPNCLDKMKGNGAVIDDRWFQK